MRAPKEVEEKEKTQLTAEIIAIGTEILLGDIVNTNASYLARELAALGINTYRQQVVGDNPKRVMEAFEEAYTRANLVLTTGGLGPTTDDLSKEMGARYFGVGLKEDPRARQNIEDILRKRRREITPNNWKQATLPEGAQPLYNENGTAPGFILEKSGKILIMMPGPPSEMKPMFDKQVKPFLAARSGEIMVSRTLHLCGVGESFVEHELKSMMDSMTNPTLAPYAKTGYVDLRITAKAVSQEEAAGMIHPVEEDIRNRFGSYVFGADGDTLEGALGRLLLDHNLKIATAESCTGGLLAGRLVNYPGISGAFEQGFVTYSNEAKQRYLGVSEETLRLHGAVSWQTACEMARGAAEASGADVALSVTGIAGPDGATPEKPVGLVYIGMYLLGDVSYQECNYQKDRQGNRENTVVQAINMLRIALLEKFQ